MSDTDNHFTPPTTSLSVEGTRKGRPFLAIIPITACYCFAFFFVFIGVGAFPDRFKWLTNKRYDDLTLMEKLLTSNGKLAVANLILVADGFLFWKSGRAWGRSR